MHAHAQTHVKHDHVSLLNMEGRVTKQSSMGRGKIISEKFLACFIFGIGQEKI